MDYRWSCWCCDVMICSVCVCELRKFSYSLNEMSENREPAAETQKIVFRCFQRLELEKKKIRVVSL